MVACPKSNYNMERFYKILQRRQCQIIKFDMKYIQLFQCTFPDLFKSFTQKNVSVKSIFQFDKHKRYDVHMIVRWDIIGVTQPNL